MQAMSQVRTPQEGKGWWAIPCVLITAGLWAYHNSLSGEFIFDDYSCIPENPAIRSLWPPWAALSSRPEIAVII